MVNLTALQAEVERQEQVTQAAITLIQGLADQIEAAGGDAAKLEELTARLRADADVLGAAVEANTK